MASLFQDIYNARPEEIENRTLDSLDWFRQNVRDIKLSPLSIQKQNQNFVTRMMLGRMYMFFYDPKTKDTLPYWDKFPIIVPIKRYATGYLGLNLHYIAPRHRALLLNSMYEYLIEDELPQDTRFKIVYELVKSVTKLKWGKPCLKQYLNAHIDGRICQVMPEYFDMVAMLPTQKFQKQNANYVYRKSRDKF